jgi:phosphoserine phosphatase RsbU/P
VWLEEKGKEFDMNEMWMSEIAGMTVLPQTCEGQGKSKDCEQAEVAAPFCAEDQRVHILALEKELAGVRREQAAIQRSFFEAAQIQRRLCAPRQLDSSGFQVAGEIFPVRHLSGDFFKVFELGGSSLGIVIGDIAGKGLSAGIWMPHVLSLIHSCARTHSDPGDAIAAANRKLCSGYGEPPLAAAFFARLEEGGEICYCNAGLPPPVILKRDNGVESLENGGPMLGAMSAATFDTGIATMDKGDTLIACSDGVTECENSREQELGSTGLLKAARAYAHSSASQTLFSIIGSVVDFADGQALRDDLTLLVVQRVTASFCGRDSGAVLQ